MPHQSNLAFSDNHDVEMREPRLTGNPIDTAIGQRIRHRRAELGLSQTTLGAGIGVSFQQIQKYEWGTNRVSASALYQIAGILGVPVSFFFGMMPETVLDSGSTIDDATTARLAYMCTREGERLVDLFQQVPASAKKHLFGVMSALATPQGIPPVEGMDHEPD